MSVLARRIAAVLWVVWGLVHILAGVLTVSSDTSQAVAGIADAVDPETLVRAYAPAVGAIVRQHGWNLGWIGLTTLCCAPFVWRGRVEAICLAALVGGLADAGYFLFLDLGGFVHFVPGSVMTLVSGGAIVLSFASMWGTSRDTA